MTNVTTRSLRRAVHDGIAGAAAERCGAIGERDERAVEPRCGAWFGVSAPESAGDAVMGRAMNAAIDFEQRKEAHRLTSIAQPDATPTEARTRKDTGVASIVLAKTAMPTWAKGKAMDLRRDVQMLDRIEELDAALATVGRVVTTAIEDSVITATERREIVSALLDCDAAKRLVKVDGQHVSAAIGMIGTLARTLELTPKVVRKLHEQERDLLRIEARAELPQAA